VSSATEPTRSPRSERRGWCEPLGAAASLTARVPAVSEPTAWTTGTVESDGESLHVESAGDGPETIVFCHGAGGSHAVWYHQVVHFAPAYRVVIWDARGFGTSTDRARRAAIPAAVADLAAVLDWCGAPRAHLVGQSMGGWTALGFALAEPARVHSLTLANSIAGVATEAWRAHLAASPQGPPPKALGRHPALGARFRDRDPAGAFLYQQLGGEGYGGPAGLAPHVRASLVGTTYDDARVGGLDLPVLCIGAGDDDIFPPALVEAAADRIPNSRVVILEGAGHSPYFEIPDAWNAALEAFLHQVERG